MRTTTISSTPGFSRRLVPAIAVLVGVFAFSAEVGFASADGGATVPAAKSKVTIKPYGLKHGKAKIMDKVSVGGTVVPYKNGQHVRVYYYNDGHKVKSKSVKIKSTNGQKGTFRSKIRVDRGGKWTAQAKYSGLTGKFPISRSSTKRKGWGCVTPPSATDRAAGSSGDSARP
ncbi:MAG: hypothetical protein IPK93_06600 [Solirubrobacterales bacterium]|nr:hypothetical protein [Solirubrobacterales bacterium]